jgi:hypothetical protein
MVVNGLLSASTLGRWILLTPALIVGVGIIGGVFILLGRGFMQSVRESGHPRWIAAGFAAMVVAVVILTWLGVSLPRE